MLGALITLLLFAIIGVLLVAFHKPETYRSPSFRFTRISLIVGVLVFWFGYPERSEIISISTQIIAWICLIFVFKGLYKVAYGR